MEETLAEALMKALEPVMAMAHELLGEPLTARLPRTFEGHHSALTGAWFRQTYRQPLELTLQGGEQGVFVPTLRVLPSLFPDAPMPIERAHDVIGALRELHARHRASARALGALTVRLSPEHLYTLPEEVLWDGAFEGEHHGWETYGREVDCYTLLTTHLHELGERFGGAFYIAPDPYHPHHISIRDLHLAGGESSNVSIDGVELYVTSVIPF